MALTLSNISSEKNESVAVSHRSTILLRIVLTLVAVILLFQLKLLRKVNEIQSNVFTSFTGDAPTGKAFLPSASSAADEKAVPSTSRATIDQPANGSEPTNGNSGKEKYANCPFRDSSLVESIYVYPTPGTAEWHGDILSDHAKKGHPIPDYPWVATDQRSRSSGVGPYETTSQLVQYNTELLVRDVLTHPNSCLRTDDPERATLFYVPYLPAAEFHNGTLLMGGYEQSPHARALQATIADGDYSGWEQTFGLTARYWKRRGGADHIMVYSEPMHGLWHPRSKRGNFHFIRSQYQLRAPIVVSVELSTTFVDMYPMCARKNILMPYPNTDGRWFNGALDRETATALAAVGLHRASDSPAALASEVELERRQLAAAAGDDADAAAAADAAQGRNVTGRPPRVMAQFYKAGNHGTCSGLRRSMSNDYKCTPSGRLAAQHGLKNFVHGYRHSTFCPCPGGDSPSAKRMYDALLAGCIPVILSHDFVWPFTAEFDRTSPSLSAAAAAAAATTTTGADAGTADRLVEDDDHSSPKTIAVLDPKDYSIRLQASDHATAHFDKTCQRTEDGDGKARDLQSVLDAIPEEEILRLRRGVARAADAYSYYEARPDLPDNPLREGTLPDGGAAQILVRALEERASGRLWQDCQRELEGKDPYKEDRVFKFVC